MALDSPVMAVTTSTSICRISRIFRPGCTLPTRQTTGPFLLLTRASFLPPTYSLTSAQPSLNVARDLTTLLSLMLTFITAVEMRKAKEDTSLALLVIIASSGSLLATSILPKYARSCISTKCLTILPWATINLSRQFYSAVTMTHSEFKKLSSLQSSLTSTLRTLLRPSATQSRKSMCRCLNSTRVLVTNLPNNQSLVLSTKVAILDIRCPSGSTTSANTPLIRARLSAEPLTILSSSMNASPYGMIPAHPSEFTFTLRITMKRPSQTQYSCHYTNG